MSNDTGNDLAQRFIAALKAIEQHAEQAVEAMTALFGENATLANSALDLTGTERRGRAGARTFWSDYAQAFSGAKTEFSHVTVGAGAIGLFWTTAGALAPAAATPLSYAGSTLIEHDGAGTITGFRGYYDTRALKEAPARES